MMRSIFAKLVFAFMVVLIPLYALSLIMNESASRSVKEQITASLYSRAQFYMYSLETDFNRIIRLEQEFVNDSDLNKLSNSADIMEDFDKTIVINRLRSRLGLLKTSNPYILNVGISIASINRTLSTGDIIGPIDQSLFRQLSQPTDRYVSPFLTYNDRLFISVPYPEIGRREDQQFVIAVEIDKAEISSVLHRIADNAEGGVALFDNRLRWQVAHRPSGKGDIDAAELARGLGLLSDSESEASAESGYRTVTYGGTPYIVAFEQSPTLDATLLTYLPEQVVLGSLRKYRDGYWVISLVSAIVVVLFSYLIYRLIHQPLRTMVVAFRKVEHGNLDAPIVHKNRDEFSYLYSQYNSMIGRLKVLIHEVIEHQYRVRLSELKQLQLQINPHFLYNSFIIIYRMAKVNETENVMRFSKYLGSYYQYITHNSQQEVPLKEELDFVRTYVEIQKYRYAGNVHIDFPDPPPWVGLIPIPRLILQPLLENCYKHGLIDPERDGIIAVSFRVSENRDELTIGIEDNGDSLEDTELLRLRQSLDAELEPPESTGLYNVHRRLRIKFGNESGVRLERSQLGGLKVEVVLPLSLTPPDE
ncbi:sensor histidine kinase [Paenibacillus eucommiae]|uniref:Two-component system sensor histidine kinase YesM n=1 Tax=Paenibacillus eucommiae TaxID=1355755 RepID=A0ABS4J4E2_9BACL|nr:sensor histidine kinase [Paenibacillus eucommiae]MBP1994700.1 two-component system sensor histidine kinase YesM [Paenibacillus eucommiae]